MCRMQVDQDCENEEKEIERRMIEKRYHRVVIRRPKRGIAIAECQGGGIMVNRHIDFQTRMKGGIEANKERDGEKETDDHPFLDRAVLLLRTQRRLANRWQIRNIKNGQSWYCCLLRNIDRC